MVLGRSYGPQLEEGLSDILVSMQAYDLEELGEEEGFRMSNLYPEDTGLPFVVWVSTGNGARHDIRVKVCRGRKIKFSEMVSVGLRPTVHVVSGSLPNADLELLRKWVEVNMDTLLAYWEEEISTANMLRLLKGV